MPSFITKKLNSCVSTFAIIVGLGLMLVPEVASAQLGEPIRNGLYDLVVAVFGSLMWLGGLLLDNSIEWFIRDFASSYDSGFGGAVEEMWLFVRDLINLSLILGFVYIAFRLILSSDDGGAKRNLVMLIIAALLVNFSLFFSKAIIDVSHIASVSILDSLPAEEGGDTLGVSAAFADVLSLTSVFNDTDAYDASDDVAGVSWGSIVLTLLTFLVAAFVFAAIGFLIMVRFIVLIFLMLFSPVIVLGMIFPNLRSISSRWLNTFLKQAFLAPAVLICLYASLVILSAMKNEWETAVTSGAELTVFEKTPFFFLGMGLLVASLVIARQMGAYGASGTMAAGKRLRGYTQRMAGNSTFGAAAWTARNTAGRYASHLANDTRYNEKYSSSRTGRTLLRATQSAADSSFDARKVGGVGKELGIGEGRKGGFDSVQKERKKAQDKMFERMGTLNEEEIEQEENVVEAREKVAEIEERMAKATTKAERKKAEQQLPAAKEELATERTRAEYKNQLAAITSAENNRYNQGDPKRHWPLTAAGAAAGAGAAALLSGGAAIPIIAAAAGAGTYIGTRADASHAHSVAKKQRQDHGEDGTKKKKASQQKKQLRVLAEAQKETVGDEEAAKTEESKSDDS